MWRVALTKKLGHCHLSFAQIILSLGTLSFNEIE